MKPGRNWIVWLDGGRPPGHVARPKQGEPMSETYEILALKYAAEVSSRRHTFLWPGDQDGPQPMSFFVWVIRNENRTILVDTGFDGVEARRRDFPIELEPVEALQRIGIAAETVETVIISHLHFDHAGTLDRYPAARFHIQESELAYATGPCMCEPSMAGPYTPDHVCSLVKKVYSGRVQFHDGDGAVAPGVTVHRTGGHTVGLQSVRVATASGYVVLASDASHLYENFETRSPFSLTIDVAETLRTYTRLEQLATSRRHIIPGHDPLVLERYPTWKEATAGLVHRLDLPRLG
jgi:glyoxylase-like metal-dependent hydrolase (beta-lactamase superfamily II)